MAQCCFVSDLHGNLDRYRKLITCLEHRRPEALFIGGDLLPPFHGGFHPAASAAGDFIHEVMLPMFAGARQRMGRRYPPVYLIPGNDDPRSNEPSLMAGEESGLWHYMHMKQARLDEFKVFGYAYVPPTPFLLKDWERYDVSRYVDPGCVSPEEGLRSVPQPEAETRYSTIQDDLQRLTAEEGLGNAIFLFHAPPYQTLLDRADLDGKKVEHVPLDLHVGSIAIRRFIEERRPLITLHGHVHESSRLTGAWMDHVARTTCYSGAWDGPQLAVVRFDTDAPDEADRLLL